MRIRTLILSALTGLLGSSVAWADVSFISFRMGEDGTIRDIQTSLTSDTMALTAPIVEPNGTLTTPEEESERQMDKLFLTEEAIEELNTADQIEGDVLANETAQSSTNGIEADTTSNSDLEPFDTYPRQLTLSPVIPAGANDSATDCAAAGGTWTTYGGNNYCCNSNAQAYQEGGSWALLMPQCGCSGANVYRSLKSTETGRVCCRGREQVASLDIGGEGIGVIEEDSPLCYCPDMVNGREVKEITSLSFTTAASGVLFCCAENNRVQTPTEILTAVDAYCECYNDLSKCNEAECENVGYTWCNNACQRSSFCSDCPAPGSIVESGTDEICCNDGHQYDEDEQDWATEISMECVLCEGCSCPGGGVLNSDRTACCKGGYAWNDEDAYDKIDVDACGCPEGADPVETDEGGVCCYTDTDGARKYYGMGSSDEDKANAIRWCGCSNEAERKEVSETNGYMCCKNGEMMDYTKDVLEAPDTDMIRQYCGCADGLHYADDGSCVECMQDSHCAGRADNKNKCEIASQTCVACYATSQCETGKLCDDKICKSCEEINPSKRYYINGTCVECTQDSHCASRTDGKTLCDPDTLTCEKCVLHNSSAQANEGCSGEKGYCIISSGSNRICSVCRDKNDCSDGKSCQVSTGDCVEGCGDVGINPTTGECNCSGATPVFDIYRKKCVKCYDSVARDWTDLGCNKEVGNGAYTGWASKYSPKQTPQNEGKPVCYVKNASDLGTCVTCYNDDHCVGDKICTKTDGTGICDCPAETTWIESTKRCATCTANYGASSGKRKCPDAMMPFCSNGTCICEKNYDSNKKDGDGKCPQKAPTCSAGRCKCTKNYEKDVSGACPSSLPWCDTSDNVCKACPSGGYDSDKKKCVECDANSTWDSSSKKCVCKSGYGVIGSEKKCTAAHTSGISGNVETNCKEEACQTKTLFTITTVNNMLYELQFTGTTSYGDWAEFTCDGAILDKTTSSGSGRQTKKWCSNYAGQRDTNPNDSKYCTTGSSCTDDDGGSCGRGVITTSDDNVSFLGDGGKCRFKVTNGNGGCTAACTATCKNANSRCIKIVPKTTSYTP